MEWTRGKPTEAGWYLFLLEKTLGRQIWFPKTYGRPIAEYYDGMPWNVQGKLNDTCYYLSLNDIPLPEAYENSSDWNQEKVDSFRNWLNNELEDSNQGSGDDVHVVQRKKMMKKILVEIEASDWNQEKFDSFRNWLNVHDCFRAIVN
jgi:hypothetical protein